jgi:hypothetical protein
LFAIIGIVIADREVSKCDTANSHVVCRCHNTYLSIVVSQPPAVRSGRTKALFEALDTKNTSILLENIVSTLVHDREASKRVVVLFVIVARYTYLSIFVSPLPPPG